MPTAKTKSLYSVHPSVAMTRKWAATHRIAISSLAEIDNEVRQWLRMAFEEDR